MPDYFSRTYIDLRVLIGHSKSLINFRCPTHILEGLLEREIGFAVVHGNCVVATRERSPTGISFPYVMSSQSQSRRPHYHSLYGVSAVLNDQIAFSAVRIQLKTLESIRSQTGSQVALLNRIVPKKREHQYRIDVTTVLFLASKPLSELEMPGQGILGLASNGKPMRVGFMVHISGMAV